MTEIMDLQQPNLDLVREHIAGVQRNDRYRVADEALGKLFVQLPRNASADDVLLKVTTLYSYSCQSCFIVYQYMHSSDLIFRYFSILEK